MNNQQYLQSILSKNFPKAILEITDSMGDDQHLSLLIIDSSFEGKSRIERHRMVIDKISDKLHSDLHALSIKIFTPHEYSIKHS